MPSPTRLCQPIAAQSPAADAKGGSVGRMLAWMVVACGMMAGAQAAAQTESVLVDLTGTSGAAPGSYAGPGTLIQASDGNFYGTTVYGGAGNCTLGCGTVYKISSVGTLTLLHSFSPATTDGLGPSGGLVQGTDGNFYGTTVYGGTGSCSAGSGCGTVFKITSTGTFTLLHSFTGTDGVGPEGSLVQGTDGNFYGMTIGTVFKITSTGIFTLLHTFDMATEGANPSAGLVQGVDGNFYGMTSSGGTNGYGSFFKITSTGSFTVLHSFSSSSTDGGTPADSLVQGADGSFYGTTTEGGAGNCSLFSGCGTAFKITPSGAFTVLHSFTGTDGEFPQGSLVLGTDGNYYGTTSQGGADGAGTLFDVTSTGGFGLIHGFPSGTIDGADPFAGMVQGWDGIFYGTTPFNTGNGDGTVYKLTPATPLPGPVPLTVPASVTAGAAFTLRYSVYNAYSATLQQCFATNTAGTTDWTGIYPGSPTASNASLTAPATVGTYTYALTCGGMESGFATLNVVPATTYNPMTFTVSAVTAPFGSTAGVAVTATEAGADGPVTGGVVTFSVLSPATGSFSPATCTLSAAGTCTTSYLPTGTLAVNTYSNDIQASFAANNAYNPATANNTLTITAGQTINFPVPAGTAYAGTSVMLSATASSGLPVTYSVVSGPGTLTGSVLTYTGAGTVVVEADQKGNSAYPAAAPVQVTIMPVLLTEPVGTTSPVVSTVVIFAEAGTLNVLTAVTQGNPAGSDFRLAAGGSCAVATAYAAGQSCTLAFTFTPTRPGLRLGGIGLTDGPGDLLANSYLYGVGVGPMVTYSPGTQSLAGSGLLSPAGVAVDGSGNIVVAQAGGGAGVAEIAPNGTVTQITTTGSEDVAVDGSGNIFSIAGGTLSEILAVKGVITAASPVVTVSSSFYTLDSVAVDGNGDVFVADAGDGLAGSATVYEVVAVNGAIPATPTIRSLGSGYGSPTGVAVDSSGDVFVSDSTNAAVYELLAVNGSVPASPVIRTLGSGFGEPSNVRLDDAGNVFVTDVANRAVYELLAVNGVVPALPAMLELGTGLLEPQGLVIDGSGNLYVADQPRAQIVKLDYADPPTLSFAATYVGYVSSDSPQTVTVMNDGNAALAYAVPAGGFNPSITPGFLIDAASTCAQLTPASAVASLAPGATCTDVVSFKPVAAGADVGALTTTDNALNAVAARQTVPLNGTGETLGNAAITLSGSPNPVFLYNPITFTATVSTPTIAPTGTVLFFDGTTSIGSGVLAGGVATLSTSTLALGTHNISAQYSGDGNFAGVSSTVLPVLVEDFSLTILNPSVTIPHGGTAVYNLLMTTVGGTYMASTIGFTIAGAPDPSPVTFSPSTVVTGSGTTGVTLTIATPDYPVGPWSMAAGPRVFAAALVFALGLLPFGRRRRRNAGRIARLGRALFCVAVLTGLAATGGCADSWPPQHYSISVTARSGALSHTASATLVSE